jgi:hypothetical protein
MKTFTVLHVVAASGLISAVLALEGPWCHGGLPVVIWINLLRETGMYHGVLHEILFSVVFICLTEVKPIVVLYLVDRLTDMLIYIGIILKRPPLGRRGDMRLATSLVLLLVLCEKVAWLYVFVFRRAELGSPSLLVMLLLYVTFGGSCLLRALEWCE